MASTNSLQLFYSWNSPVVVESDFSIGSVAELDYWPNSSKVDWIDFALPFGSYRFHMEDNAAELLECYQRLEDLCHGQIDETKCFLADGGLQMSFARDGTNIRTKFFVMPTLNGRVAHSMSVIMPMTSLISSWQSIAATLLNAMQKD